MSGCLVPIETITLENGKYRFEFNSETGEFHCLRHGETWRSFTGDKAVYSLSLSYGATPLAAGAVRSGAR